jgi:hypothetical protein
MTRSRTSAPRLPPPPSDAGCRSRTGVCCCPPSNEAHSAARATTPHPSENMPICAYCNTCLEDHGCPAGTTSCVCCIRCLLWVELMSSLESADITVCRFLCLRGRGCVYAETCVYARGYVYAPAVYTYYRSRKRTYPHIRTRMRIRTPRVNAPSARVYAATRVYAPGCVYAGRCVYAPPARVYALSRVYAPGCVNTPLAYTHPAFA